MVAWHEEEWAQKKLEKLQEAVSSSNHRKIVRILDKLMDKYDLDEPEIWDQLGPRETSLEREERQVDAPED